MADIFGASIVCDACNQKMEKGFIARQGFKLRAWKCNDCTKQWIHPTDQQDYENFSRLKDKQFQVKLRLVGNSYTVSIPREIIEFEEEMQREMKEMNKLINMSLEGPDKLSLFFSRKVKRFINEDKEEQQQ
tara:strand:+ start:6115 stop:6507 length:393 start_codon:yes stop_codon:yes gene_type:complete